MLTVFETMIKWSFQASYDRKMIVDLIGVADNKENGIEDSSIILLPYVFSYNTPVSNPTPSPTATAEPDQEILTLRQRNFERSFCADL